MFQNFKKLRRETYALLVVLFLVALVTAVIIIINRTNQTTQNIFDKIDSANSVPGVIAANKKLISAIKDYSNLPQGARSEVIGTLQNICKSSQNVQAAVDSVVNNKYAQVNINCKDAEPTKAFFAVTNNIWRKISDSKGQVSCERATAAGIPFLVLPTCTDKSGQQVANTVQ